MINLNRDAVAGKRFSETFYDNEDTKVVIHAIESAGYTIVLAGGYGGIYIYLVGIDKSLTKKQLAAAN